MTQSVNISNLKALRTFLAANAELVETYLDMGNYYGEPEYEGPELAPLNAYQAGPCGTNMCLVGWAAASGVEVLKPFTQPYPEGWNGYASQKFFNGQDICRDREHGGVCETFDYLFGDEHPNSVKKALQRLDYVIENGQEPENWSY